MWLRAPPLPRLGWEGAEGVGASLPCWREASSRQWQGVWRQMAAQQGSPSEAAGGTFTLAI